MSMPKRNIEWKDVSPLFQVEVRRTPKGGNFYFVATDEQGRELVPNWGSVDAFAAQEHLNRLAKRTCRQSAR